MDKKNLPENVPEFIGTTVHEINNFIFALSGFSELLHMESSGSDEHLSYLSELGDAIDRLENFGQKLLALTGRISTTIDSTDLKTILSIIDSLAVENITVVNNVAPSFKVDTDIFWMKQAFSELIHFSKSCQSRIEIRIEKKNNRLRLLWMMGDLCVQPNPDTIFQPYYSTRIMFNEKGLGLSWLPGLFDSLNNAISFSSIGPRSCQFIMDFN